MAMHTGEENSFPSLVRAVIDSVSTQLNVPHQTQS